MYVAKYPLRGVECRRPAKLAEARSAASPPSLKKGYALFSMNHKKNFLCSERRSGLHTATTSSITPSRTQTVSG